ncbi:MAG: 30S ribosomal protein S17 [Candidatus Niyogibacteria bacterium]|nr:30S ribosomal protein S17 [Candidatus Niyogibacteria bacterium]
MESTPTRPKKLSGTVVSTAMQKTVVVAVERLVAHPKYGKFLRITKKYKAHDEKGDYKVGDKVVIEECKPLSKDKHFQVVEKE